MRSDSCPGCISAAVPLSPWRCDCPVTGPAWIDKLVARFGEMLMPTVANGIRRD